MTREITIFLSICIVTHLFDKVNFTVNICKHVYIRLEFTFVKVPIFPKRVPCYCKNITCVKIAISYIGLTDASKGYQFVKGMSWSSTIRTVESTVWYIIVNVIKYAATFCNIGMYPAFVKCPVSGFLVGSSSHVKESVSLSKCWMSGLL
jgi:hypothetical protein